MHLIDIHLRWSTTSILVSQHFLHECYSCNKLAVPGIEPTICNLQASVQLTDPYQGLQISLLGYVKYIIDTISGSHFISIHDLNKKYCHTVCCDANGVLV